jgi:hypothetical protein
MTGSPFGDFRFVFADKTTSLMRTIPPQKGTQMPIYTIIYITAMILGFISFGTYGSLAGFLIAAVIVGACETIKTNHEN